MKCLALCLFLAPLAASIKSQPQPWFDHASPGVVPGVRAATAKVDPESPSYRVRRDHAAVYAPTGAKRRSAPQEEERDQGKKYNYPEQSGVAYRHKRSAEPYGAAPYGAYYPAPKGAEDYQLNQGGFAHQLSKRSAYGAAPLPVAASMYGNDYQLATQGGFAHQLGRRSAEPSYLNGYTTYFFPFASDYAQDLDEVVSRGFAAQY